MYFILIRRRCERCGCRLELVAVDENKFYFKCPKCGKVVIFTLKGML